MVEFEWDQSKAAANRRKHGVDFAEAQTTFYDRLGIEVKDDGHSDTEERWVRIAMSERGRLLVSVFVEREERIRLVSSRPATAKEKDQYEG